MIPCQRHLFDLPDDIAYLNCAYMSPILKHAAAIGADAVARKCRPWTISPDDFFHDSERAREVFAELLGARGDDIAVVPAASYGIAVAAANLPLAAGRRVLVLADQFPSNVYSWQALAEQTDGEVVTVARPADGDWSAAILARLDERVAIAALPHCHWTDGGLIDLAAVAARCREVGSALVIDATQSLGALPFDLAAIRPDFLVCAGYKWLLGPYSVGYLYVAPRWQGGRPLEHNWIARAGSEDFSGLVGLSGRLPAGRAPLRRRRARQLRPAAGQHRRAGAVARLGPAGDRQDPGGEDGTDRSARRRARPRYAAGFPSGETFPGAAVHRWDACRSAGAVGQRACVCQCAR